MNIINGAECTSPSGDTATPLRDLSETMNFSEDDSVKTNALIQAYEQKIAALRAELNRAPKVIIQDVSMNHEHEALYRTKIRQELDAMYWSEMSELKSRLASCIQEANRYKAERDALLQSQEQLHFDNERNADSRDEIAKKRIAALEEQIMFLQNSISDSKSSTHAKVLDLQGEIDEFAAKNRTLQRDLDILRQESEESRISSNEKIASLTLDLRSAQTELKYMKSRAENDNAEVRSLERQVSIVSSQRDALQRQLAEMTSASEILQSKITSLEMSQQHVRHMQQEKDGEMFQRRQTERTQELEKVRNLENRAQELEECKRSLTRALSAATEKLDAKGSLMMEEMKKLQHDLDITMAQYYKEAKRREQLHRYIEILEKFIVFRLNMVVDSEVLGDIQSLSQQPIGAGMTVPKILASFLQYLKSDHPSTPTNGAHGLFASTASGPSPISTAVQPWTSSTLLASGPVHPGGINTSSLPPSPALLSMLHLPSHLSPFGNDGSTMPGPFHRVQRDADPQQRRRSLSASAAGSSHSNWMSTADFAVTSQLAPFSLHSGAGKALFSKYQGFGLPVHPSSTSSADPLPTKQGDAVAGASMNTSVSSTASKTIPNSGFLASLSALQGSNSGVGKSSTHSGLNAKENVPPLFGMSFSDPNQSKRMSIGSIGSLQELNASTVPLQDASTNNMSQPLLTHGPLVPALQLGIGNPSLTTDDELWDEWTLLSLYGQKYRLEGKDVTLLDRTKPIFENLPEALMRLMKSDSGADISAIERSDAQEVNSHSARFTQSLSESLSQTIQQSQQRQNATSTRALTGNTLHLSDGTSSLALVPHSSGRFGMVTENHSESFDGHHAMLRIALLQSEAQRKTAEANALRESLKERRDECMLLNSTLARMQAQLNENYQELTDLKAKSVEQQEERKKNLELIEQYKRTHKSMHAQITELSAKLQREREQYRQRIVELSSKMNLENVETIKNLEIRVGSLSLALEKATALTESHKRKASLYKAKVLEIFDMYKSLQREMKDIREAKEIAERAFDLEVIKASKMMKEVEREKDLWLAAMGKSSLGISSNREVQHGKTAVVLEESTNES